MGVRKISLSTSNIHLEKELFLHILLLYGVFSLDSILS